MRLDTEICLANHSRMRDVLEFQRRYIKTDNQVVYSREFHCESGLRKAIHKNNVIVAYSNPGLVGIVRFYCQVRQQQISIYQFAVAEDFRGGRLAEKMFAYIQNKYTMDLISKCPVDNDFNNYYKINHWDLLDSQIGLNYWKRSIVEATSNSIEKNSGATLSFGPSDDKPTLTMQC